MCIYVYIYNIYIYTHYIHNVWYNIMIMHNTTEWQSQCSDPHANLNEARNVRQRLDEAWGNEQRWRDWDSLVGYYYYAYPIYINLPCSRQLRQLIILFTSDKLPQIISDYHIIPYSYRIYFGNCRWNNLANHVLREIRHSDSWMFPGWENGGNTV